MDLLEWFQSSIRSNPVRCLCWLSWWIWRLWSWFRLLIFLFWISFPNLTNLPFDLLRLELFLLKLLFLTILPLILLFLTLIYFSRFFLSRSLVARRCRSSSSESILPSSRFLLSRLSVRVRWITSWSSGSISRSWPNCSCNLAMDESVWSASSSSSSSSLADSDSLAGLAGGLVGPLLPLGPGSDPYFSR